MHAMETAQYYISLHYSYYSIECRGQIVESADPDVKWMIGKSLYEIRQWVKNAKGKIEQVGK